MAYAFKMFAASTASLIVCGLAINYTPWAAVAHLGDIVLFTYLTLLCVALPGASWWAAMRLMRML
jgi:hypothetical protein